MTTARATLYVAGPTKLRNMTMTTKYTTATAGTEVDSRAKRHVELHHTSYKEAVNAVLASDKALAQAYSQPATRVVARSPIARPVAPEPTGEDKPAQGNAAGFEVHARAEALMQKHPNLDYREAVGAVLSEDTQLKARYAEVQS